MISSVALRNVRTITEICLALVSILAVFGLVGARAGERTAKKATAEIEIELRAAQEGKQRSEVAGAADVLVIRASCSSWNDDQSGNIDNIVAQSFERLRTASDFDPGQIDLSASLPRAGDFETWSSQVSVEDLVAIGASLRDEAVTSASEPVVR